MPLPEKWASPEDFATLFQYLWHRDFPRDPKSLGARRADWTAHIGIVIRSIADLVGLFARFEIGGRKDAVLRSEDGDEIAIEWEWEDIEDVANSAKEELKKLRSDRKIWRKNKDGKIQYAVLISYTHDLDKAYQKVTSKWQGAPWPLLLILIDWDYSKKLSSRRDFKSLHISLFDTGGQRKPIRMVPALPWKVIGTRWSEEHIYG